VKVWPAIVSVPVRSPSSFLETLKATKPFPLPLLPDVMVIQDALLPAVHAQPLPAETLTVTPDAFQSMEVLFELSE
jgi:hypothetical protein